MPRSQKAPKVPDIQLSPWHQKMRETVNKHYAAQLADDDDGTALITAFLGVLVTFVVLYAVSGAFRRFVARRWYKLQHGDGVVIRGGVHGAPKMRGKPREPREPLVPVAEAEPIGEEEAEPFDFDADTAGVPAQAPPSPAGNAAFRASSTVDKIVLGAKVGDVLKEAWCDKRSSKNKWQPRYVALTASHLCYLDGPGKPRKARYALPLDRVAYLSSPTNRTVVVSSRSGQELEMRCNEKAAAEWVSAIEGAVEGRGGQLQRDSGGPVAADSSAGDDPFEPAERAGVEELRRRVAGEETLAGWLSGDASLVRFLRARDGNVAKAEKMLRDHGAWRVKSDFAAVVARPPGPEEAVIRKYWPDGMMGPNSSGVPVQLIRIGAADLPGIQREVGGKRWVEFCAALNEKLFADLRAISEKTGKLETSCDLIMDMQGLGLRHAKGVPIFSSMLGVCEPNFPERLKHIFVIRAPWIFASLYAMVRPMLNKGTADKVLIFTDDYLPALLEHMPAETIPKSLGGAGPEPEHISLGGYVPHGALAAETPGELGAGAT
eukprot:CAMPEP_0119278770 /NCGR_PEP_ID=MMETSP1329-20130426/19683_1 /TAXON_ID=114041 /ORGANISM="Genus nov. species nov., Strain RCC1024" /LENGTH=546 /DNA_ID=CAMNT_0007279297 /DNA_START=120 /DNA_END=1756 /DNA_ORIENTATION=-